MHATWPIMCTAYAHLVMAVLGHWCTLHFYSVTAKSSWAFVSLSLAPPKSAACDMHPELTPVIASCTCSSNSTLPSSQKEIFVIPPSSLSLNQMHVCAMESGCGAVVDIEPEPSTYLLASGTFEPENALLSTSHLTLSQLPLFLEPESIPNHCTKLWHSLSPNECIFPNLYLSPLHTLRCA
uniref:Uncharacterized protein n=1 Tax=Eutreptiella gymnastica TaxID=73025 RepID=A0A7S1NGH3_9EUGL|mmetsp:Transcript_31518/g.56595  ORF Transcript_31518/g.56595 Transcript_31518/m.56595 type:complete len:181 (+) Transcript_31518:48-590(+)